MRSDRLNRLFVLPITFLFLAGAHAAEVGTTGTISQGFNAFGTPVGVTGAVDLGNFEESGSTLQDLVGQGGNAITVNISDDLAKVADLFILSTVQSASTTLTCGFIGTQIAVINAQTESQLCSQIHSQINQGCSQRPDGALDIVGPSFCDISHWEFLTGVVPPAPTTVNITGITDAEAATVDYFSMFYGGILIQGDAADFALATNGSQLAAAISGLSALINASYSGGTLTITAVLDGPTPFSNIQVEFITPATITSVDITDISDAEAAAVNRFRLLRNGQNLDQSGVDFGAVSNVSQLADQLNIIPGIDVSNPGAGRLTIASTTAGNVSFTPPSLRVLPVVTTSTGSATFVENGDDVAIDPGLVASYGLSGNMSSATVTVTPFANGVDEIVFSDQLGISGSVSLGTLTLSGGASIENYQTALRSVQFSSDNDDLPANLDAVFRIFDGTDSSDESGRPVSVNLINDLPTISLDGSALSYNEGASTAIDPGLSVSDPDNTMLTGAVVFISGAFNPSEDLLEYNNQAGISGSFAGGGMTLSGTATLDAYRDALRAVRYRNTSDAPNLTPRIVSFRLNDGTSEGPEGTRQVIVNAVNDAPLISGTGGSVEYPAGGMLVIDPAVEVSDPDSATLSGATVSIGSGFVEGDDFLLFVDGNGIVGDYDGVTGVLTLSGSATAEDYLEALRTVVYFNANNYPAAGQRQISFRADDGSRLSGLLFRTIVMPTFVDGFEDR